MNILIINSLFILITAFLLGTLLLFFLQRLSKKYKILLIQGTPLIGGFSLATAFFLASILGIYLTNAVAKETSGLIFASLLMLIFGTIDDWRELSVGIKFLVQIICASVLIAFGVKTQIVYIGAPLNTLITLIWILAITNAFNHLDIMDGVAAFTALIVSVAFCVIAFFNHDIKSIVLSLALIGSILSFLRLNLPAARVYMGNAGSHFLGFLLAGLALTISYAPLERRMALLTPILILGFPIYDTLFLILMRLLKRKIPFNKSNDHLVLRCLAMGYSKRKALGFAIFWNLFFVFAAMLAYNASNWQAILVLAIVFLIGLWLARNMSRVAIND
ncbi:MAG: MraY family glycosyltransferase [Candidatus Omnitrophica bacterium]|nr:MraY family glycosyltransferase [Candidatus Omnitrophota bacterium]